MIPKIIHYCWLSQDPIPLKFQQYIDGWHRLLPDYEFIKWDFTRFDKDSSVWVSEAFDNKKYAFAADYIRLYAVYNYGGIYMDMDIELLKPFDDLLDKPYMFANENPDRNWIEAGCFGAEKGNDFLKKCLDYYEGRHFIQPNGTFDTYPLPIVMGSVIRDNHLEIETYSWKYFTAKTLKTGIEAPDETTYAIHHFAESWKSEEEQKIRNNARKIRNSIPFIGEPIAFLYDQGCKSIHILKTEGFNELINRIKQFFVCKLKM